MSINLVDLPSELHGKIFSNLSPHDMQKCRRVCKVIRDRVDYHAEDLMSKICKFHCDALNKKMRLLIYYDDDLPFLDKVHLWHVHRGLWSDNQSCGKSTRLFVQHLLREGPHPTFDLRTAYEQLVEVLTAIHAACVGRPYDQVRLPMKQLFTSAFLNEGLPFNATQFDQMYDGVTSEDDPAFQTEPRGQFETWERSLPHNLITPFLTDTLSPDVQPSLGTCHRQLCTIFFPYPKSRIQTCGRIIFSTDLRRTIFRRCCWKVGLSS